MELKTWQERCEKHPDHQSGIVTNAMIQARMQEEIDELRTALREMTQRWKLAERLRGRPRKPIPIEELGIPHYQD